MNDSLLVSKELKDSLAQACSQGVPIAKTPPLQLIVHFHNSYIVKTELTVAPIFSCLCLGAASHKAMEEVLLWCAKYAQKLPPKKPSSYINITTLPEKRRGILNALLKIPFGETRTYGEIATQTDSHPRAVGAACKSNPFLLLFPCHRVLGSRQERNYVAGSQIQETLLNFEAQG